MFRIQNKGGRVPTLKKVLLKNELVHKREIIFREEMEAQRLRDQEELRLQMLENKKRKFDETVDRTNLTFQGNGKLSNGKKRYTLLKSSDRKLLFLHEIKCSCRNQNRNGYVPYGRKRKKKL